MKGVWRKTIGGLKPADAMAEEVWQAIPVNAEVMAEVTRPRSLGHHKKFFALLKLVYENQENYQSMDELLIAFKVALGHCYPVHLKTGQVAMVPKSISFAKLDQIAFNEFWDKACSLVITKFLPGVNREDLEAEIMTMVS
jgi:hypothetical protein